MEVDLGVWMDAVVESVDRRLVMLRCSARALTAALDALYAGLPGGFVMPCLLPVMTMAAGVLEERDWTEGT